MEQFRHIGEVLGSLKALMVLRDEIQINQRQCCLIHDIFSLAFDTISDEIRQNLKLDERATKWKPLEFPLRELCRVFKEGELYIKHCLDSKDWWGKSLTLSQNRDCVEFHIHNLLCYFPAVIEAIESAGEMSGLDQDENSKKKVMLARKYDVEWNDPKLFQWRFGKQYLVPKEICNQMENAWREDRWRLIESLKEKKGSPKLTCSKNEQQFADMLLKKLLNGSEKTNNSNNNKILWPISILLGSKDYQVRRRLGRGKEYKEIQWLGQSFALRNFVGEREAYENEIFNLLSLSHPNILQCLCGFYDEGKKEFSLVMELMNKDLWTYMKENCGPRRQILFSIPVVVDLMLQMARGIEYLHTKKIYHGNLNPCNILLRARNSQEGYFQAKVVGFGLSSVTNGDNRTSPTNNPILEEIDPSVWYAPEVLTELEQTKNASTYCKYSEKADAYSFGMICFELLTGKVPFEDNHLQGDRTSQNIIAGERPLFPYHSPKYLVSLIKKCWQTDPSQRPTFSSICRILRYTKKFLSMNSEYVMINPEFNQLELQNPPVDCCDLEGMFFKSFLMEKTSNTVSQIPYEMFAYKVVEKGKINNQNQSNTPTKDKCCECEPTKDEAIVFGEGNEHSTVCTDANASIMEDLTAYPKSIFVDTQSSSSDSPPRKSVTIKTPLEMKAKKDQGTRKLKATRSLPSLSGRISRTNKVNLSSMASSPLSPGKRRPTKSSSESERKGNQSPLVTTSSTVRRKIYEGGNVSDSKPSLKLKTRDQSPFNSLKTKKAQLPLNPSSSPISMRRVQSANNAASVRMQKGFISTPPMSPSRTFISKKSGHVSDMDSAKIRGRLSAYGLSPLSPYVRNNKTKRESMSPFTMSPLSPYVRETCGHVSD
ncbi:mitogen-activated protein kinase kinase kinase 7-like [Trifolium pratense]|uniref:mitogen-activated protein kinase kinase kinase 7-like n=1 Tax=Trifolium pratense TaxID=57577 RepID=UPI001E690365|nr:mitogen-activated protein kinase kinase kinase 7-like [Trifolium pratense]